MHEERALPRRFRTTLQAPDRTVMATSRHFTHVSDLGEGPVRSREVRASQASQVTIDASVKPNRLETYPAG